MVHDEYQYLQLITNVIINGEDIQGETRHTRYLEHKCDLIFKKILSFNY